jgi:hypothetical protein
VLVAEATGVSVGDGVVVGAGGCPSPQPVIDMASNNKIPILETIVINCWVFMALSFSIAIIKSDYFCPYKAFFDIIRDKKSDTFLERG